MKLSHSHNNIKTENKITQSIENENFSKVADIYKLLSDKKRLQLFWILCHKEECVINLAIMLKMSSPAIYHHLKELKNSELISSKKVGKETLYSACNKEMVKNLHFSIENTLKLSCPSLEKMECSFLNENSTDLIEQVHKYICSHLFEHLTIESLANKFYINQTTLKQNFKKRFKKSIGQYIIEHKMAKASELLIESEKSIKEISKLVGYSNQSKFSTTFFKIYNIMPLEYRKKYKTK